MQQLWRRQQLEERLVTHLGLADVAHRIARRDAPLRVRPLCQEVDQIVAIAVAAVASGIGKRQRHPGEYRHHAGHRHTVRGSNDRLVTHAREGSVAAWRVGLLDNFCWPPLAHCWRHDEARAVVIVAILRWPHM